MYNKSDDPFEDFLIKNIPGIFRLVVGLIALGLIFTGFMGGCGG